MQEAPCSAIQEERMTIDIAMWAEIERLEAEIHSGLGPGESVALPRGCVFQRWL